ncbi:MAG: hypothetical protein FWD68_11430 [Alphaproteobacteria bacterium]|nr:hypothetical protein [Alphaproteobacteria bacterium]
MSEPEDGAASAGPSRPAVLSDALRRARIEAADRSGVVVDLHDAEVARLEILNEALDPLFAQVPVRIDLFDRGISQGHSPRLWIDMIAHIAMGRDKRLYRFLQDTSSGRVVLAESHDVQMMVDAVTQYVARRMIERERALSMPRPLNAPVRRRRSGFWSFLIGVLVGALALFGAALVASLQGL